MFVFKYSKGFINPIMTKEEAKLLFDKYRRGLCSREELALLERWYVQYARENAEKQPDEALMERDLAEVWNDLPVHENDVLPRSISHSQNDSSLSHRFQRRLSQIAAAVVLFVGIGAAMLAYRGFFDQETNHSQSELAITGTPPDNRGGQEGYILLEDGRVIPLDDAVSGTIYEDGETRIQKTGGRIVYAAEESGVTTGWVEKPVMRTLMVPKGKQYELVLSDGTQVWLNSFSSIRFPDKFGADSRAVEITGEVYFEVASDTERPFLVTTDQHRIRVLGTHFNINAYEDEPEIRTTVLEGSVEVSVEVSIGSGGSATFGGNHAAGSAAPGSARVLSPGQQSRYSADGGALDVVAADLEEVVAWKSGLIHFEDTELESILRQVARWYDVEVHYRGTPPQRRFTGGVSRNAPLSDFLKVLEINDIRFVREGRTLTILNK